MAKKPIRILIVDDDEIDCRYVTELLRQIKTIHFEIDNVTSPEQALPYIEKNSHDICLVDYFLGDSDGLELIQQANLAGYHLPFIVVTGSESEYIDKRVINSGAADYIPKIELSSSLLERTIRHALERNKYIKELQILATRDPLTNLANRAMFYEQLELLVAVGKRHNQLFAVLMLDLDGFKQVNDTLGHQVGDELLKEVAERLTNIIRKEDVLARLGGDEFSIILNKISSMQDVEIICQKLLNDLCEPGQLSKTNLSISTSIGCAIYPNNGDSSDQLMKNADLALYKAKALGKNNFQHFSPELQSHQALKSTIKDNIKQAIDSESFFLIYQPCYHVKTNKLEGVEALLRWNDSQLGDVSTSQIIPLIEQSGLIINLGNWVLATALKDLGRWQQSQPDLKLGINISIKQLRSPNFITELQNMIDLEKVTPGTLELEINENVFNDDSDFTVNLFNKLSQMNVSFAINNYGAENSSIRQLIKFPISKLKIEPAFMAHEADATNTINLSELFIKLAHGLNLKVTAVGVENQQQLDSLKQMNCDFAQGYFLQKPQQASVIATILNQNLNAIDQGD